MARTQGNTTANSSCNTVYGTWNVPDMYVLSTNNGTTQATYNVVTTFAGNECMKVVYFVTGYASGGKEIHTYCLVQTNTIEA